MKTDISLVIAAAGASRRMGGGVPKQYMLIEDLPVLIKTVKAFCDTELFSEIVISVPAGDEDYVSSLLAEHLGAEAGPSEADRGASAQGSDADAVPGGPVRLELPSGLPVKLTAGGAERQDSVLAALRQTDPKSAFVLVQDGARPYTDRTIIELVIRALEDGADAAVPCVAPKSTIRTAERTLDRSSLYEVQTPQGFRRELLIRAYEKAAEDGFSGTDDASLAERLGVIPAIVPGDYKNIKITTEEDLPRKMRIGTGYDVHRLAEGRKLMLGCVEIPYEKGLLGHSDADVIAHAIADALLGAAAMGDIGKLFPDSAAETEGMAGSELLKKTAEAVRSKGFTIVNADATLIAEKPKISPYTELMRERVSEALGVPKASVSIKATTEEGLGFTGNGSAMAAQAVAMLEAR
ncbi:MAG: 2-C-methyl-D-erythritol 2,4-cyclodiphosphate synthase [Firmicutes bacterium]|nr:2-C-methyl-D-erythritol 2,4-cyclodiphosphate synthase [Bacillota bacterium]